MKIRSNTVLKGVVPGVILLAIIIGIVATRDRGAPAAGAAQTLLADLTPDELKVLGIEGDTPQDTLRTLLGRMRTLQEAQTEQSKQLNQSVADKEKENTALRQQQTAQEARIGDLLAQIDDNSKRQNARWQEAEKSLLGKVNDLLGDSGRQPASPGNASPGNDLPVGLGFDGASGLPAAGSDGVVWIDPQDAVALDKNGRPVTAENASVFPSSFGSLEDNAINQGRKQLVKHATGRRDIESATPVYTLPQNSTLMGSVSMTALIGRVPINGKITDPYPFKVVIGRDNLTANGIDLPEVEGAILSGTATGDWVLSCVRGEVTSMTFVFTDGTVRTVPAPADSTTQRDNGEQSGSGSQGGGIGWLSDPNGIPCLAGDRKTNAGTYLPTLFGLAGAQAAANALSASQVTSSTEAGAVTSALTGSSGQYVLGQALSGGTSEAADWFRQRYGQMFDAVYVRPGTPVAVHISRQLPIDYETQGRKVRYDTDPAVTGELD
ncbi:TIGR03752 family integrating conjugative element protein [Serratia fonticola]